MPHHCRLGPQEAVTLKVAGENSLLLEEFIVPTIPKHLVYGTILYPWNYEEVPNAVELQLYNTEDDSTTWRISIETNKSYVTTEERKPHKRQED